MRMKFSSEARGWPTSLANLIDFLSNKFDKKSIKDFSFAAQQQDFNSRAKREDFSSCYLIYQINLIKAQQGILVGNCPYIT